MKLETRSYFIKEGRLKKENEKTTYSFVFEVGEGIGEIQLDFDYFPRVLKDRSRNYQKIKEAVEEYAKEATVPRQRTSILNYFLKEAYPLRNLLNLCLYGPKRRFLGRWDWNSERPVRISSAYSSPGFTRGKIISGSWMGEIEVHAIVTEECRYRLKISLIEKIDEEDSRPLKEKLVKRSSPKPDKAWYHGELHVHSHHSDGKNTVEEIVEAARKEKLDFISLTDHNTVSGFSSIPHQEDFLVIRGMELTTYHGHALALGLSSFIDWHSQGKTRNINEIIDEVHAQRGLFAIAHPFTIGDPVCVGCTWKLRNVDYHKVDLMEVWAGPWAEREVENSRSLRLWNDLLNQGLKIVGVSGRDWHDVNEKKAPIPQTFVYADSLSEPEILEGLRKGRVIVSSGPMVNLSAKDGDRKYQSGDEIKLRGKKPLSFQIQIENLKAPSKLPVIKNGLRLFNFSLTKGESQRISFSDLPEGSSWYRCEIYTENEELLCVTNPIFSRSP
ncbi:MAG: CehA/McbA family metallohydrolase [bacterium]